MTSLLTVNRLSPRRLLRALGWATAGAGLGAATVAGVTAHTLNAPKRPWPDYTFTPFELGEDADDIAFAASDGVKLAGWWFDRPEAPIGWVKRRRPDARVAVVGFSMGAATAILEAADDPRVEALVVDSPFATMTDVVAAAYRSNRLPTPGLLDAASLASRLRHGYSFAQVRPLDAVARLAPRPVLLLHGTEDHVIPFDHALRIRDAAAPGTVEFVPFEGADHCGGYFVDRPGYIARVDEFLRRALAWDR